jgi:hypothetical protein
MRAQRELGNFFCANQSRGGRREATAATGRTGRKRRIAAAKTEVWMQGKAAPAINHAAVRLADEIRPSTPNRGIGPPSEGRPRVLAQLIWPRRYGVMIALPVQNRTGWRRV